MKIKTIALLLATAFSSAAISADLNKSEISAKFQSLTPFKVDLVTDNIPGFYEVTTDKGIFYISKDGEHLLSGSIHKLEKGLPNLTALRKAELAAVNIEKLRDTFITYKAPNEKHEVLIFFDTHCGYCQKMHSEVSTYTAAGITVHYAMYPRNGVTKRTPEGEVFSDTYNSMMNIVCNSSPQTALDMSMRGAELPEKSCSNSIKDHYDLGGQMGVRGTPAVYGFDGQIVSPGYTPVAGLLQKLGGNS